MTQLKNVEKLIKKMSECATGDLRPTGESTEVQAGHVSKVMEHMSHTKFLSISKVERGIEFSSGETLQTSEKRNEKYKPTQRVIHEVYKH